MKLAEELLKLAQARKPDPVKVYQAAYYKKRKDKKANDRRALKG